MSLSHSLCMHLCCCFLAPKTVFFLHYPMPLLSQLPLTGARRRARNITWAPFLCSVSGLSVLGFSQKLGPPRASQRRLVPVTPALLQPPPSPVGLCGSTPRLRLPHLATASLPPQGQRAGAELHLSPEKFERRGLNGYSGWDGGMVEDQFLRIHSFYK